jgi:hypothetical protein
MPNDRAMPPQLIRELTLAILDDSATNGMRTIKAIRSCLDAWEAFLQDREELVAHLIAAHKVGLSCTEADPASLNQRHWQAHGSDLATLLAAHPLA